MKAEIIYMWQTPLWLLTGWQPWGKGDARNVWTFM